MTNDERELLKQLAGWVGGISQALADGCGIYDLQRVNTTGLEHIGPLWERVFGKDNGMGIRDVPSSHQEGEGL
jgi:hypothetical protein